jgi:carbamoyl-phosphate synthase small subunit
VGFPGETFGELVFNTGMTGYQEVLTDPSYLGQIVVMTYPEIGIYGVNPEDVESDTIQVAGFVVHHAIPEPFNHRARLSFTEYLEQAGIPAVEGIDTRALTRLIRSRGAMRGAISTSDLDPESLVARVRRSPEMLGRNLVQELNTRACGAAPPVADVLQSEPCSDIGPFSVVVVDAGAKQNIVRDLASRGAIVTVVPYDASIDEVLSVRPDGVLISNGPGDPAVLDEIIHLVQGLLERRVPLAGICLGHQLLGLAVGGQTYKMRFGHRGANHPVKDLDTGRVLITTQNHGFAVDPTSLEIPWEPLDSAFRPVHPDVLSGGVRFVRDDSPIRTAGAPSQSAAGAEESISAVHPPGAGGPDSRTMAELLPSMPLVGTSPEGFGSVEITHLSLNDGTLEGLRLHDVPALSVQFHPEASPGPHDAKGFFATFAALMEADRA